MIRNLTSRFLSVRYNYTNPIDRQRATNLLFINWMLAIGGLAWGAIVAVFIVSDATTVNVTTFILLMMMPLVSLGINNLIQTGRAEWGAWLTVGLVFLISSRVLLERIDTNLIILVMFPIVLAGLLLGRRGALVSVMAAIVLIALGAVAQTQLTEPIISIPADTPVLDFAIALTILILIGITLSTISGDTEILIQQSVGDVSQFQLVSHFTSTVQYTSENSLYAGMIDLIRGRMGYSFAQVFLVNELGEITSRVRTGLGAEEGFSITFISLSDASILNEAARNKKAVLISTSDSDIRRGHFLPTTAYGLAMPILFENRVVAVIDIQEDRTAFSRARVQVLAALSEQTATLVRDLRTVEELRQRVKEQENTVSVLRTQLQELKQSLGVGVTSAWDSYLSGHGSEGFGYDMNSQADAAIPAYNLPGDLRAVMELNQIQVEDRGSHQAVLVPITLRGEVLGAMSFSLPSGQPITERQQEMAQNVANRLALALENKRLFEQSQAQAIRERKANEIASLLIGATDVDSVLTIAVNNFNEALGAINTRIHLQPDTYNPERLNLPSLSIEADESGIHNGHDADSNGNGTHNGSNGKNGSHGGYDA